MDQDDLSRRIDAADADAPLDGLPEDALAEAAEGEVAPAAEARPDVEAPPDEDPLGMDLVDELRESLKMVPDDDGEADGLPSPFDFKRPGGMARNFEQNLRNWAENLAKIASISFTNLFRANTVLAFSGLGLRPCGDFLGELSRPTCVATVMLAPLKGRSLINLELPLCFSLLKKLMGGAAEPENQAREFTEIERGIIRVVILKLLERLQKAGSRLLALTPEFVSLENNPDYVTGVSAGETLVHLSFQLKLESEGGRLDLCIPLSGFEPVRDIFDPQERPELRSPAEVEKDRQKILHVVQGTECLVVVKYPELPARLNSLMGLKEGDLIHLDQSADAPLVVEVAGKPLFRAEAGRVQQRRAVRLIERISEE